MRLDLGVATILSKGLYSLDETLAHVDSEVHTPGAERSGSPPILWCGAPVSFTSVCVQQTMFVISEKVHIMKPRRLMPNLILLAALLVQLVATPLGVTPALAATFPVIDDFETPLVNGMAPDNIQVGFFAAQDGNSGPTTFAATAAPPAPVPGATAPNNVLQMNFAADSVRVALIRN